jgi:hypothetical protein
VVDVGTSRCVDCLLDVTQCICVDIYECTSRHIPQSCNAVNVLIKT